MSTVTTVCIGCAADIPAHSRYCQTCQTTPAPVMTLGGMTLPRIVSL